MSGDSLFRIADRYINSNEHGCILKYEFVNVGGNTATYINFTVNNEKTIPQFTLAVGDKINLVLILPLINEEDTEYKLKFEYGDVVSDTKYYQQEIFLVERTNNRATIAQRETDLISAPNILNNQ